MEDKETGPDADPREAKAAEDRQATERTDLYKAWTPGGKLELKPDSHARPESESPNPESERPAGGNESDSLDGSKGRGDKDEASG